MYETRIYLNGKYVFSPFGLALEKCSLIKNNINKHKQKGGTIVTDGNYEFNIISDANEQEVDIIISGNNNRNCFSAKIIQDTPDEVILISFGYYETCSNNKKMERVTGTRSMMNALIKYIKENYSNVKKIILSDEASIKCSTEKGTRIFNLYNLYFLKYQKPYYVKNFNFKFEYEDVELDHQINIELFNKTHIKIDNELLNNFKKYIIKKNIRVEKLEDFLNKILNIDLNTFLQKKDLDCYLYFDFIDFICKQISEYKSLIGKTYYIDL